MATLEVHDGQGRVQFIELERDHPILFGTSPHCEIVLEGPGINPVHGRIRWKRGKFKVEASPDAEYVLINGHKMSTGSITAGDEVTVGPCRIFLLRVDEGPVSVGRAARGAAVEESRTMVVPPPVPATRQAGGSGPVRPPVRRSPEAVRDMSGRRDLPAEKPEWARQIAAGELSATASGEADAGGEAQGLKGRFARALRKWLPQDTAPGEERIISSPLVVGLLLMLGVLVGMGFWLKAIIASTIAERTFNRAMANFEDGDYRTAIRDFDAFAQANPEDSRAPKARVIRSLANVRQYVSPNGSTWTSALESARGMYEEFHQGGPGLSEAFRDERSELAELVIRIGEGLADRARGTAEPQALAEAESAVPLHREIAGEPAQALLTKSRLAVQARRGPRRGPQVAGPQAGPGRDGPGAGRRLGVAGLRVPRPPGRAVRRPDPGSRADRADDGRQRADPQVGHGRHDPQAGRARAPDRAAGAADERGAPDRYPAGQRQPGRRVDRVRPGRRDRVRHRRDDRRPALAGLPGPGVALRPPGRAAARPP